MTAPAGLDGPGQVLGGQGKASLNEEETTKFGRREGIYHKQLKLWRDALEAANDWDKLASLKLKSEQKGNRKRIKDLEKELRSKEKALAVATALLVLKKSVGDLGGPRGRMINQYPLPQNRYADR